MGGFLQKIHGLPEEARKLLAGICMLVSAIAFFGVWTSFASSRLVALAPSPASGTAVENPAGISQTARTASVPEPEALSPAAGIADTLRGFQSAVSGGASPLGMRPAGQPPQGFFASASQMVKTIAEGIGRMSERAAEFLYRTAAPYVPPYL